MNMGKGTNVFKSREGFGFDTEERPSNTAIRDLLGDGRFTEVVLMKTKVGYVKEGILKMRMIGSCVRRSLLLSFFHPPPLLSSFLSFLSFLSSSRGAPLGSVRAMLLGALAWIWHFKYTRLTGLSDAA